MDRLIADISDSSRVDAELSRTVAVPVDVAPILATLAELHAATRAEGEPAVALEAPPTGLVVRGVEGRLVQVFRNLLGNALSFSPRDGKVAVRARPAGAWVEVVVEDEGPGIPEAKLEGIFERFYSERPQGEGFGSHLPLVAELADLVEYFELAAERFTLGAALARLREGLKRFGRGTLQSLTDARDWPTVTVAFGAMLELVKEGEVRAVQRARYGEVVLERAAEGPRRVAAVGVPPGEARREAQVLVAAAAEAADPANTSPNKGAKSQQGFMRLWADMTSAKRGPRQ